MVAMSILGCSSKKTDVQYTLKPEPEPVYTLEENIGQMLLVGKKTAEIAIVSQKSLREKK